MLSGVVGRNIHRSQTELSDVVRGLLSQWRYRETVLVLCTLAFFVTMFGRLALSPVVPDVAATFDVTNTHIGIALSGMWAAYALTQFPSGVLAEKVGERRVILAAVGGTAITAVIIALSPTFLRFALGAIVLGAAAGLHYSVATSLLTRAYDDIGTAIGFHNTGAPIAGVVTPVVVAWIAVTYGWRPAVGVTAIVGTVVFGLFVYGVRPTPPRRPDQSMGDRFEFGAIRGLLSRPEIRFVGVIAVLSEFVWQAVTSFLPTFFMQYHGYSAQTAGLLFAGYFVVLGLVQVVVGVLSDRTGRDTATAVCMVAGIVGLGLLITTSRLLPIVVALVLLALGMGWTAAVLSWFVDHIADNERESGFGLVRTVYMILAASGSAVVGFFADQIGWGVAFGLLILCLVTVLCLLGYNRAIGAGY